MLIRKKLTAAEFSNPFLRYNPDCDCVQFTPDNGETWVDQPANDPRTSDGYRLPALTGDDTQCRAAEGMTALIRAIVDQRIQFDTDAELAAAILGIVAFIPGFNVLYALLLAFVGLAVTIARELLEAAFTEPTYDQLRCLFYCNIDADGQMSQTQFDLIVDSLSELNDLAEIWVLNIMLMVGCVGMSDAGVSLEAAADCDECECGWCYQDDLTASSDSFASTGFFGTWSSGIGWTNTYADGGGQGYNGLQIVRDFGTPLDLTYINILYYHNSTGSNFPNSGAIDALQYWDGSSWVNIGTINCAYYPASLTEPLSIGGDVGITTTKIRVTLYAGLQLGGNASDPGGDVRFFQLTFAGTGEEPFGASTC